MCGVFVTVKHNSNHGIKLHVDYLERHNLLGVMKFVFNGAQFFFTWDL